MINKLLLIAMLYASCVACSEGQASNQNLDEKDQRILELQAQIRTLEGTVRKARTHSQNTVAAASRVLLHAEVSRASCLNFYMVENSYRIYIGDNILISVPVYVELLTSQHPDVMSIMQFCKQFEHEVYPNGRNERW